MASIGDIRIFVIDERNNRAVEVTEYPVERGFQMADHVIREPLSFTCRGLLTGDDAEERKERIIEMMNQGEIVRYRGRNRFGNVVIEEFNDNVDVSISNGYRFDMFLKEIRISEATPIEDLTVRVQAATVDNKGRQQLIADAFPLPTGILSEGSRGNNVKQLQNALNAAGFDAGAADGIYGPMTRSAVERFQRAAGITADGIYGPETRGALEGWEQA